MGLKNTVQPKLRKQRSMLWPSQVEAVVEGCRKHQAATKKDSVQACVKHKVHGLSIESRQREDCRKVYSKSYTVCHCAVWYWIRVNTFLSIQDFSLPELSLIIVPYVVLHKELCPTILFSANTKHTWLKSGTLADE